jgi:hypothetical protein
MLELVLSARHEFLIRAKALRAEATARAIKFVVQTSTNLSRAVLLGLAALLFVRPPSERIEVVIQPADVAIVRNDPAPAPEVSPTKIAPAAPSEDQAAKVKPESAKLEPPDAAKAPPPPSLDTKPLPAPLPPAEQEAPPWSDAEIADAKAECAKLLDKVSVVTEPLPPQREGICGAPAPRELRSFGDSKVKLHPPATLTCPMIAALHTWVSDKLQPMAKEKLGSPIASVVAGSYSCRNRYGRARAPISEHALMNAIDISAFVLENGKVIRVSSSWTAPPKDEAEDEPKPDAATHRKPANGITLASIKRGARHNTAPHDTDDKDKKKPDDAKDSKETAKIAASEFLHQAHDDACRIFGTVLGPDTNAAHHDHLHLDMKARKRRSICQ